MKSISTSQCENLIKQLNHCMQAIKTACVQGEWDDVNRLIKEQSFLFDQLFNEKYKRQLPQFTQQLTNLNALQSELVSMVEDLRLAIQSKLTSLQRGKRATKSYQK